MGMFNSEIQYLRGLVRKIQPFLLLIFDIFKMDTKIITKRLRRFNHSSIFIPHLYPGKSPLRISSGIIYVRDSLEGFCLIDMILCLQCDRVIGKIFYQKWIYKQQPNDLSWILLCYDNKKLILSKKIGSSKFLLPKIEIWLINKNLLLPGEY
jgi:hypothetical protein